jgi:hypothetical protein
MLEEHYIIRIELDSQIKEINVESYSRGMHIIEHETHFDKIELINSNQEVVYTKEKEITADPVLETVVEEAKKTKARKTTADQATGEDTNA